MALSQQHEGLMLVPWFNRTEWELVYKLIYEKNDIACLKKAQKMFKVWKLRSPKLPIGVGCTSILLDTYLLRDTLPTENINLVLASSIMRFLNLCCCQDERQGTFTSQARSLEFPEWLINLRHDIAHNSNMPSFELLTLATDFCFRWIQENYWEKQWETLEDYVPSTIEIYENVKRALTLYCKVASVHYTKNNQLNKVKDIKMCDTSLLNCILNLGNLYNIELITSIDVALVRLMQYIINNSSQTRNDDRLVDLIISVTLSEGGIFAIKCDYRNFDIKSAVNLPEDFVHVWSALIDFIFLINGIQQFLEKLVKIINSPGPEDSLKRIASLWITHLSQRLLLSKLQIQPDLSGVIKKRLFFKFPKMRHLSPFPQIQESEMILDNIPKLYGKVEKNSSDYTILFAESLQELCNIPSEKICMNIEKIQTEVNNGKEQIDIKLLSEDEQMALLLDDTDNFLLNDKTNLLGTDDESKKRRFVPVRDTSTFANCPLGMIKGQMKNSYAWMGDENV